MMSLNMPPFQLKVLCKRYIKIFLLPWLVAYKGCRSYTSSTTDSKRPGQTVAPNVIPSAPPYEDTMWTTQEAKEKEKDYFKQAANYLKQAKQEINKCIKGIHQIKYQICPTQQAAVRFLDTKV